MSKIFEFGERLDGFEVPVLNERAVRAGAGLMFVPAFIAFMNAMLLGNFQPTRVFVVVFLMDFTIRIFINPRYSPSLILGQWIVRKQQPEYTGAPQKRFAWAIGFVLALAMFYLMVLNNVIGPINMLVCGTCLTLLFFETAFGICLGCKIYNLFNRQKALLCPGGVCEVEPVKSAGLTGVQWGVLVLFLMAVTGVAQWVYRTAPAEPHLVAMPGPASPASATAPVDAAEAERCKVPEFAKRIGHEDKWKLHNNCK